MSDWSVRRLSPHYLIQLPLLHMTRAPAPIQAGAGRSRNLSEGAACVELAERFSPRAGLSFFLDVPPLAMRELIAGQKPGGLDVIIAETSEESDPLRSP